MHCAHLLIKLAVYGVMVLPIAAHAEPLLPSLTANAAADRLAREIELKETERQLKEGADARRKFEAELSAIRNDRARLMQKTIDIASSVSTLEAAISATESRLSSALSDEERIAAHLESRRAVMTDLLSGLQRIGQIPPPIVLANPEDLLSTIRGAMMLSAALPELADESRGFVADLQAREATRKTIEDERQAMAVQMTKLASERQDLALALDARQRDEAETDNKAADEAARVAVLAAKSQTIKDLLGHTESEIGAVMQATDAANAAASQADEDAKSAETQGRKDQRAKLALDAFRDPTRITPKVAFSELKGLLKQPVAGSVIRGFNDKDQLGNPIKGLSVATRSGAVILAPSDGWVSYAGSFRSFGQLLILNAGGGYYILLAGMDRMTVGLGQFVLAGEPVATMPGPASSVSDHSGPTLYIEFRKDGTPFDPAPWWSPGSFEKVKE